MAKLTLQNVGSGYQTATQQNANNAAIEAALENTLSRDGTSPNQLNTVLDMNGNRIINLDSPQLPSDAVRYADVTSLLQVTNVVAPSQTGNKGKSLSTDGTNIAWGNDYQSRTATEISAGVIPVNMAFPPGHAFRWGAVPDGDGAGGGTNNAAALQNLFNSGHKRLKIPAGIYRTDSILTIPPDVIVEGEGSATVIDGTNCPEPSAGVQQGVVQLIGAGLTSLGSPNVNPVKLTKTLSFASSPAVSPRDVLIIYNPTNGSFNGKRPSYREGEFCQVRDLSGSTINLVSYLFSGYVAANVTVYKVSGASGAIRDLKVIAPPSNDTMPVLVRFGIDVELSKLNLQGSDFCEVLLDRCFNIMCDRLNLAHLQTAPSAPAVDYAINIGNSQHVRVVNSHLVARRHAVTTSGTDTTGVVPCRDIRVLHSYLATTGVNDVDAANTHGNCEFVEFAHCTIDGGVAFGGDHVTLRDSIVHGGGSSGGCPLRLSEMVGWNFTFENLEVFSNGGTDEQRSAAFDLGGNTSDSDTNTTRGGTLRLKNVKIIDESISPASPQLIGIRYRGCNQTFDVVIDGLEVEVASAALKTLFCDKVSGSSIRKLTLRHIQANTGSINLDDCNHVDLDDISIIDANTATDAVNISVSVNNSLVRTRDVRIITPTRDGITITGVGTTGVLVRVDDNTVLNTVSTFFGVEVNSIATAFFKGNFASGAGTNLRANTITTLVALANQPAISKVSVMTDIEIGSDGADIIMPGLPTATPGGSGKVWNNSGVLNIT